MEAPDLGLKGTKGLTFANSYVIEKKEQIQFVWRLIVYLGAAN
jgi:hypothetical protein